MLQQRKNHHKQQNVAIPGEALSFFDLFCGCGGFTLGLLRAGLKCLASIDFESRAVDTLRSNLIEKEHARLQPPLHVLHKDLTQFSPHELGTLLERDSIDIIVGGPPCQGFSTARQVDGANHGQRLKEDSRRDLYRFFLDYVAHFQPKVFVIENVLGLRTAAGGEFFTRVQGEARNLNTSKGKPGYRVQAQIEDAWQLGVPQKRRRQLIIGVRNDLPGYFPSTLAPATCATPKIPLGAVIGDLPRLKAGSGEDEREYDLLLRTSHIEKWPEAKRYLKKVLEIDKAKTLTNHVARPHSARDLRDFKELRQGENSKTAIRDRQVAFLFPYDKTTFKDRYTRQSMQGACSTIVAHLAKDGLMFIHPTQDRSLTPREAARIQSFPDWFRFPAARTHAFRMIGNAVPPLVAEAVGLEIRRFLERTVPALEKKTGITGLFGNLLPSSSEEAADILAPFVSATRAECRRMSRGSLLAAWYSLLYLLPGLHPDNATDHGSDLALWENAETFFPSLPKNYCYYYVRSGWPVPFVELGREVSQRARRGEISEREFYCADAQRAGLAHMLEESK